MTRTQKIRLLRETVKEFEQEHKASVEDTDCDIEDVIRFVESYNKKYEGQRQEEANILLNKLFK